LGLECINKMTAEKHCSLEKTQTETETHPLWASYTRFSTAQLPSSKVILYFMKSKAGTPGAKKLHVGRYHMKIDGIEKSDIILKIHMLEEKALHQRNPRPELCLTRKKSSILLSIPWPHILSCLVTWKWLALKSVASTSSSDRKQIHQKNDGFLLNLFAHPIHSAVSESLDLT